jgi:hypothetical protein
MDIWNNDQATRILNGGQLHVDWSVSDNATIKKIIYFHWNHDRLMFTELVVQKPKICQQIVLDLHSKTIHFGERCMLAKVNKHYFWHNRANDVKNIVCACQ